MRASIENWPSPQGSSLTLMLNGVHGTRRVLLFCPACTRKKNLISMESMSGVRMSDERKELLLKTMTEIILEEGEDIISDIARECMEE